MPAVTPDLLLYAYRNGLFPMGRGREDPELQWYSPEYRGVLPLDGLHVPRRLKRTIRGAPFHIRVDSDFRQVMELCAEQTEERPETWINESILDLYTHLHETGYCHSVECWDEDRLMGGLYGVALGGAFFGESMFSRARDASKVALVHLVALLRMGGFILLDTQFLTGHLENFGAVEMKRDDYMGLLQFALSLEAAFPASPDPSALSAELDSLFRQSVIQTS